MSSNCSFEMGKAADPEAVRKALKDNPDVKAVVITQNETSTGVTNDCRHCPKWSMNLINC